MKYEGILGNLTDRRSESIAKTVNETHRQGKNVVTKETVLRVVSGDYLESYPIDCAILAELRRLQ